MKRITFLLFLSLLLVLSPLSSAAQSESDEAMEDEAGPAWLELDDIVSEAAVLMDADTGQVLFDKNMNRKMYPASTTKIMTGMLALEALQPTDVVIATQTALEGIYGSILALDYDEQLTVANALYGLMLPSANDVANVLAESVGGSLEEFSALMNSRAREIGAVNTHFANAHGLHEDDHYTTAYDMALITRQAVETPGFIQYYGAARHTVPPTNKQTAERPLTNQQFMLLEDQGWAYNPDVVGGKVGYTNEARHTMSTVASKNGRTLIAAVFKTGTDDKFYDTQSLFDFGFGQFFEYTVTPEEIGLITVPILDEGEIKGEVVFSIDRPLSVWLHESASPDQVELLYHIPESFAMEDDLSASVVLQLPQMNAPGVPQTLLTLELEADIQIPDVAAMAPVQTRRSLFQFDVRRHLYIPVAIVLGGLMLLILAAVLLRSYNRRRRLKARRERLNRRLQGLDRG